MEVYITVKQKLSYKTILIIQASWKPSHYLSCTAVHWKLMFLALLCFHLSFVAFGSELFLKPLKLSDDTIFISPRVEGIFT